MICFPNGKINLGLKVVEKRADGYHNLESVFYPIACHDALEILPAKEHTTMEFRGNLIAGDSANNTCLLAYHLMRERYKIPPIAIHLLKKIPVQAGLGGGSADASFLINLISETFALNLPQADRESLALEIGSDCPFFIGNVPAFCKGRGELIEPLDLDLSAYDLFLVSPSVNISTGWAFRQITPQAATSDLCEIVKEPIETWKTKLDNDFEKVAIAAHPSLVKIKNQLYDTGALYASMSGSGSAFYGLYKRGTLEEQKMKQIFPAKEFRQWLIPLK